MPLNLKASRRLSLSGFATGWDECYLVVKAVNSSDAEEASERVAALQEANDVKGLNKEVRQYCEQNILGGVVLNTNEAGEVQPYEFKTEEVAEVVNALNMAWQLEVLAVSTGSDRLK